MYFPYIHLCLNAHSDEFEQTGLMPSLTLNREHFNYHKLRLVEDSSSLVEAFMTTYSFY